MSINTKLMGRGILHRKEHMNLGNIVPLRGLAGKRKKQVDLMRPLFDAAWYLTNYPDVLTSGLEPFSHYMTIGENSGRWPNAYFDPEYYRSIAPGARKSDDLALAHYAVKGWKRGRNPSRKFSSKLYLEAYPAAKNAEIAPLAYHLAIGKYEGKTTFPMVLERPYERPLMDLMLSIHQSGLFDEEWYGTFYSDLRHADVNLLYHYVKFGSSENRRPNQFFQPQWYQQTYGTKTSADYPLLHYIEKGIAKGNNPSPNFCAKSYKKKHASLMDGYKDPLAHYIAEGLAQMLNVPEPTLLPEVSRPRKSKNAKLPVHGGLRTVVDFEKCDLAPVQKTFNPTRMNIHWVVPAFAPGGGGHMTIFRMIHFLEIAGHKQTLWINNPAPDETVASVYQMLENHFQHFTGDIRFVDETLQEAEGDAIIATDCWTVYPVLSVRKFHRRFYFVQDFEPSFHPMGSSYLLADRTYHEDLDCLCASPWLEQLMTKKYGRWARHFWLAADQRVYHPAQSAHNGKKPRIAVYARHFTARRAVELAFLALEQLAKSGADFAVDFFGAPLGFDKAPFDFVDHGVASQEELARIFQKADIGLVFSATNYSLVPQEMMACGLPIVELDVESTRAIFPTDVMSLAKPDPKAIAKTVSGLLNDSDRRKKQADAALAWVSAFSWPASADLIETAISERLAEFAAAEPVAADTGNDESNKASIIIPTLDAGPVFERVLEAVVSQRAPWPFEILVVDSGSTDGTLEVVKRFPNVRLHEIDKKDFNHGATRNLGAELTSGEFIAFLTHDAMPVNDRWLYNMVTSIERFPNAAGAFGKHYAWPDASAFTKRDMKQHFELFGTLPIAVSKDTNEERWKNKEEGWLQALHFYSDNNSCFRRSIWEKIPYRKVAFGEDQLWAWDIINAGYEKVYAPQAIVYHSHDYDEAETFERSRIESAFFKHFFGYELMRDEEALDKTLDALNASDARWALEHGVSIDETETRQTLNLARLKGYLAGVREADQEKF